MDALIHIANVLVLASFSVKRVILLRALNVAAAGFFISYFLLQPEPLMAPVAWNILFSVVNVVRIALEIRERRPPRLSPDEQRIFQLAFSDVNPRDFHRLMDRGEWGTELPPGAVLHQGHTPERVLLIVEGRLEVRAEGETLRTMTAGQFVGETSYLTGRAATADVVVVEPIRFVAWPKSTLKAFLADRPPLCAAVQRVMGRGLVAKLHAT